MTRENIEAVRGISIAVSAFINGIFVGMILWDQITNNTWRTSDWASLLGAVVTVMGAATLASWQAGSEKKRQRDKLKNAIRSYKNTLSAVKNNISKSSEIDVMARLRSCEAILRHNDSD